MVVLKIILTLLLIAICIQDIKDREVYWFLFPLTVILAGILLFKNSSAGLFLTTIGINLSFVSILLLSIWLYSSLKLKQSLFEVFGSGDLLLFLALIFSFSSISFFIIFVFGLVFSLTLHLIIKKNSKHTTVPLAGYLSLFFAISYLSQWSGIINTLYTF